MSDQSDKLCYVGNYHQIERESIRQTVCQNLPVDHKVLSNDYCILHAPTLQKNHEEFASLFKERISRQESYFEAVVFPIPLNFNHYEFSLPLNFSRAIFLSHVTLTDMRIKYIYFDRAVFRAFAQFYNCLFSELATFTGATFDGEAQFTGSHFKTGKFDHVTFSGPTQFNGWAKFLNEADFGFTKFHGLTNFDTVTFESPVNFDEAEFNENSKISFSQSNFQDAVSFQRATFKGYVSFEGTGSRMVFGDTASLSLRSARIEAPEKLSFHSVRLRPNWFVGADSRKLSFTNIQWDSNGKDVNAKLELLALSNEKNATHCPTFARYRLLSVACRQLADNAEGNNRFEEASMFRQAAMETEWFAKKARLKNWIIELKSTFRRFLFEKTANEEVRQKLTTTTARAFRQSSDYLIHALYRWTSYYGESWIWALGVLLFIVLGVFPSIYMLPKFQACPKEKPLAMSLAVCESSDEQLKKGCECRHRRLGFREAVSHSLMTATFQSVDYRKPTTAGEVAMIFEKILAPLQAALLAFALRRKFMR
jgi:uncharacterized protein YjbI with pentapeptide repeats